MTERIPIFMAENFYFEEPMPRHIEEALAGTDISGKYALGFAPRAEAAFANGNLIVKILAVNLPDMNMVNRLARARIAHQEPVIKAYGSSDDLYAFNPKGMLLRIYEGWQTSSPDSIGGSNVRILPD